MKSLEERFWCKVDKSAPNGCWVWKGFNNGKYGKFGVNGMSPQYAHRVSWQLKHGPIPSGLWVDHKCQNKLCVNPAHLQLVTPKQNAYVSTSKTNAVQTHCKRGHPLHDAKVFVRKNGHRCHKCLVCEKINRDNRVIRRNGHLGKRLKLTANEANSIRHLYFSGNYSQKELGIRFGVSNQTVSNIVTGKQDYPINGFMVKEFDHRPRKAGGFTL